MIRRVPLGNVPSDFGLGLHMYFICEMHFRELSRVRNSRINSANEFEPDVLRTFCARQVLKVQIYKERTSSLALLPPSNIAGFERQYFLEHYTQKAKTLTMY